MSDEESFVILGSTPTPSMEAYSSLDSVPPRALTNSQKTPEKETAEKMVQSSLKSNNFSLLEQPESDLTIDGSQQSAEKMPSMKLASSPESLAQASESHFSDPAPVVDAAKDPLQKSSAPESLSSHGLLGFDLGAGPSRLTRSAISGDSSLPESVAEKYILGKIDENTIKQSIFSQFPSFCTSEYDQKDVHKLQQLINDNNIVKTQLQNMNTAMKQLIEMIKQNKNTQTKHQNEIAKLRNENLDLKNELESRMDAIKINEQILNNDNHYLRQTISEKASLINNLSAQIEKLELQQQDMSYEFIKGTVDPNNVHRSDNMLIMEHSRQIKEIEHKLSEVTAENFDLKDMEKNYIDELNCLKVNLTSAEELLKKFQADVEFLRSQDQEKSSILATYDEQQNAMKQEIELLKTQLEIYRKDFEMERNARQEMAGEKEQILTDLKLLQKRNQQLIEENQQRLQNTMPSSSSSAMTLTTRPKIGTFQRSNFVCPICNKAFSSLAPLELHVQRCF